MKERNYICKGHLHHIFFPLFVNVILARPVFQLMWKITIMEKCHGHEFVSGYCVAIGKTCFAKI